MKSLMTLFFLLLFVVSYAGNFKIGGKVEITEGEMVICVDRVNGRDTIARAPFKNGIFEMTGTIDQPEVAIIGVKGYEGGFMFFLDDDKPYKMDLKNQGAVIEGGYLQSEYIRYTQTVEELNNEIREIKEELQEALDAQHFRTASELNKKLEATGESAQKTLGEILDKNAGNLFATYILCKMALGTEDVARMKEVYNGLTDEAKKMEPAMMLAKKISILANLVEGQEAPDFELPDKEGNKVRLSEIKGKIKIIDFWASWCGPCRMENPNMVKLYAEFKDKGLAVISVSLDDKKDKWLEAIEKDGLTWLHLSDLKGWQGEIVKKYNIDAVPTIFVLDENNRIIAKNLRGEKLKAFVSERLK